MKRAPGARKKTTLRKATVAPTRIDERALAPIEDGDGNESDLGEDQLGVYQNKVPEDPDQELPMGMLVPKDPQAPKNFTYYSFKERIWKKDEIVDQLSVHFSMDGDVIHKEGNEAKTHEEIQEIRTNLIQEAKRKINREDLSLTSDEDSIRRQLRNKFNYSERQTQTINDPIKERGVSTNPPDSRNFSVEVNQADIYDAFIDLLSAEDRPGFPKPEKTEASLYSTSFKRCLKIMERMVGLNDQQEKYHDYKYFFTGDTADVGKIEGTMFPIFRYIGEKQKKRTVTSICWNPLYPDLFAVGLGSYEFLRPLVNPSMICIYSVKNKYHPEYTFTTECGVMSIDFHPSKPALLAVGLYDGTVQVYDIRNKFKKPIYQSTVRTNKHTDPVWQVRWNPDVSKGSLNFYSISSDGRVTNWTLMKNKLEAEEVIKLKLVGKTADEESSLIGFACGICFDFSRFEPNLFLVGTEEGKIHRCSRAFAGQYLDTYEGHLLAVYKVKWNHYHPRTFISASADWTVKIWDSKFTRPVMSFDLGTQVVDVVWAPYSSTVFVTATLEKVYVYDLKEDKYGKLAEQKPVKHPKLTNLAFNYRDPIILVGDDKGGVTLVKLSPNLTKGIDRVVPTEPKPVDPKDKNAAANAEPLTFEAFQLEKMEKLLKDMGKVDNEE